MPQKAISFRPSHTVLEALANNGGGLGNTQRLFQIADRYLELLRRSNPPPLTTHEFQLLLVISQGLINEPASAIRGALWVRVERAVSDQLPEMFKVDPVKLLAKLKKLTFAQEIALIERIEATHSKD